MPPNLKLLNLSKYLRNVGYNLNAEQLRETALRCHLDYVAAATGNDIKSKKPGLVQKSWISLRNIDAEFRHFEFAECAAEAQLPGFLTPRASKTRVNQW